VNITQFTNSFDACVGHAGSVTEKYKGSEIELKELPSGEVAYYVDGVRGLLRVRSIDDARKAAREVVDNKSKR
jgi:hypothetical protein